MSTYRRSANSTVDTYGVDPLLDTGLNAVTRVTKYTLYTITEEKAGRPDAISNLFYYTVDLWWAIMVYNGITDVRNCVRGRVLRIPDYSMLITELHRNTANTVNFTSAVTI